MAKQLYCTEVYVNTTEGYSYYESLKPELAFTTDLGRLYRNCVREYGRCTGRVYAEMADGTSIPVGWVFVERCEYESRWYQSKADTYLRETWITVYNRIDSDGKPYDDDYEYEEEPGKLPTFKYNRA